MVTVLVPGVLGIDTPPVRAIARPLGSRARLEPGVGRRRCALRLRLRLDGGAPRGRLRRPGRRPARRGRPAGLLGGRTLGHRRAGLVRRRRRRTRLGRRRRRGRRRGRIRRRGDEGAADASGQHGNGAHQGHGQRGQSGPGRAPLRPLGGLVHHCEILCGGLFAAGAMRGDVGPRREGCYCCTLARAAVDSSSLVMLTCAGLNLPLTQTLPFAFSPGARSMVSIWPSCWPSAVGASCWGPSVPVMAKYSGLTFTTFVELLVTTTFTHVRSPPLDSTDGWAAVRLAASPIGAGLALPDSPPSAAPCTG